MKKSYLLLQKILFILLIVSPMLLWVQQKNNIFKIKPLKGASKTIKTPNFSTQNWINGDFQSKAEIYLKQHFGFRPIAIRFSNELAYRLFSEIRAYKVVNGKHDYLYEYNYIDSYYGKDYIGIEKMQDKVTSLIKTRKLLNEMGKELLIIVTPGKASFFPEHLPPHENLTDSTTNYSIFSQLLHKTNVPYLDLNNHFQQIKNHAKYPLFNKTGVHWTIYGGYLAADTLIHHIEHLIHRPLPKLITDSITTSYKAQSTDDDIEQALNLLFDIPTKKLAYPMTHFENNNQKKIKTLVIGDSFYWSLYFMNIPKEVFDSGDFLYYYKTIYNQQKGIYRKPLDQTIVPSMLKDYDLIVLETNEPNIPDFPWGFSKNINNLLSKTTKNQTKLNSIESTQLIN